MDPAEAQKRIRVTVIVHVIEARHLASKDSNHLSDPFVRVSVAGRRQTTAVCRNQINATWNQVFAFEDLDLSVGEYESELVLLQAFNANLLLSNELIGQFSFSLSKVRNQPAPHRHQVYRRWLVLTNPDSPLEEQGYLRASVTVLGPGDVPPSHERQDELAISNGQPSDSREERVISNPNVRRRGYNLSIKVFRGENLPATDAWRSTCDPFIVVRFNGVVARTPHVSMTTTPNWNHLLVLPVYTPCFTDNIDIQLYDFVRGSPDRLLATTRLKFTSLLGESFPPSWFNFYGRVDEENTASGWFCDLVRASNSDIDTTAYMGRVLMSLNTTLTDSPTHANHPCAPIKGPKTERYVLWVDIYRGSELPLSLIGGTVMIEVQFGPPENRRQSDFCYVQDRSGENADVLDSEVYSLQTNGVRFTASGDNLAPQSRRAIKGAFAKGLFSADGSTGPCQFREIEVALPQVNDKDSAQAAAQLYDIVINVYVKGLIGGQTRVGYLKIKPNDVWGYNNPPEWHSVRGLVNKKGDSASAGQLLLSASFGTKDGVMRNNIVRKPMSAMAGKSYQLRAYVYQARGLSASSPTGLASPHVRISLGGKAARLEQTTNTRSLKRLSAARQQIDERLNASAAAAQSAEALRQDRSSNEAAHRARARMERDCRVSEEWTRLAGELDECVWRTSQIDDTLDPVWFETLVIDQLSLPKPLSLAPDIEIRVCDKVNLYASEYIGRAKFPAALCTPDLWPARKRPRWLRLARSELTEVQGQRWRANQETKSLRPDVQNRENPSNHAGDILIKLELIESSRVSERPIWAHQWPRVVPCELHLGTVGLRRLKDLSLFTSVTNPHVQIRAQSIPNVMGPYSLAANKALEQGIVSDERDLEMNMLAHRSSIGPEAVRGQGQSRLGTIGGERQAIGASEEAGANQAASGGGGGGVEDVQVRSARSRELLYTPPPFCSDFDSDGRLPRRWLDAAPAIEGLARTFLLPSKASGSSLYHPPHLDNGIAKWSSTGTSVSEPQSHDSTISQEHERTPGSGITEEPAHEEKSPHPEDLEEAMPAKDENEADESMMKTLHSEEFMRERRLRTFFEQATLAINMPLDPTYAPSLTIVVVNETFFGSSVVATASISTRELTDYLYSDAVRKRVAKYEQVYEIPRFAMSQEAHRELRKRSRAESDDDECGDPFGGSIAAPAPEPRPFALESSLSNGYGPAALPATPKTGRSVDDSDVALYLQPAEGHFELPGAINTDVDDLNTTFEEDFDSLFISCGEPSIISDVAEVRESGVTLWPAQDPETMDAKNRMCELEDAEEMQPTPFRSTALMRGTVTNADRTSAGMFKATIVVRPHAPELGDLFKAIFDVVPTRSSMDEGLKRDSHQDGTPLHLRENDLVRRLCDSDDSQIRVELVRFWPTGKLERIATGTVPRNALVRVPKPLQSLFVTPNLIHTQDGTAGEIAPIVSTITSEQFVKVRVYIVACSQMPARSLFGRTSDPYLVVKLNTPRYLQGVYRGVTEHNDRAKYKSNTLDPYFGAWFELDAMFPDVSELEVQVWNANYVSDDLIGSTVIDLEDRWFNPQWHELKYQRKKIKEFRPLRNATSELSQGLMEMWVEMYRPEEAVNAPVVDIRAPTTTEWELRVVVWETRRVPLVDGHNYANLYVTGELNFETLEGRVDTVQYHETDSHTGLKDGRGIFNFRMKFSLEAPCKFPRLKLKIWERWLLSHTALGESTLDLSPLIREASRTSEPTIERQRRWVELSHADWPGQRRGEIDIQMAMVTKQYAEAHPVGNARDPPNENPFLPDPPRESFFSQVFRSAGYGRVVCCCSMFLVILVLILIVLLT